MHCDTGCSTRVEELSRVDVVGGRKDDKEVEPFSPSVQLFSPPLLFLKFFFRISSKTLSMVDCVLLIALGKPQNCAQ